MSFLCSLLLIPVKGFLSILYTGLSAKVESHDALGCLPHQTSSEDNEVSPASPGESINLVLYT